MVTMPVDVFAELESNVRSYCRAWPAIWSRARGARLEDEDGREYPGLLQRRGGAELRAQSSRR